MTESQLIIKNRKPSNTDSDLLTADTHLFSENEKITENKTDEKNETEKKEVNEDKENLCLEDTSKYYKLKF